MKIVIEKGIPIPAIELDDEITNAMNNMDVMDSFFIDGIDNSYFGAYVYHIKSRHPERRYASRKENHGARIWRTR